MAEAKVREEVAEQAANSKEREAEAELEAEEALAEEVTDESATPPEPPKFATGDHSVGARFAGRIGRHAAAYGAGAFSQAGGALLGVAIFTRFLDPGEFGRIAVLISISAMVTLVTSLTILPGTMRRIHGSTGDGEVDVDEEDVAAVVSGDPVVATTTGLALIVGMGVLVLLAVLALQGTIASVAGARNAGALILLAAGVGVTASLMRFGQYMLRMQLRSLAYAAITVVYALGGVAVAIPLLAMGVGIEAVLIGLIFAGLLGTALGLFLIRHDLGRRASLHEAKAILGGGAKFLPVIASFQILMLADTLFVAGLASFSQAGIYGVARKIATPVSLGTGVFQQSWGPMKHDLTSSAIDKLDEEGAYTARLLTFYAVFVSALVLTVSVLADQLVLVAGSSFGDAATLVPITTIGVAGHGWFIFAYRTAKANPKIRWLVSLSLVAAVLFSAGSVMLIPVLGASGAPLAMAAAWAIVTVTMLAIGQRVVRIPFEYRKLAMLGALTLAAWLIARFALPDTPLGVVGEVAVLLGWAVALFLTKLVPFAELRALAQYARHATSNHSKRRLRKRIDELDGTDAELVDRILRKRQPPEEVAAETGVSEDEAMARTVHALRRAAGGGGPTESDTELGRLVLIRRPHAEQQHGLKELVNNGTDPIDADLIKRAAAAATARSWRLPRPFRNGAAPRYSQRRA